MKIQNLKKIEKVYKKGKDIYENIQELDFSQLDMIRTKSYDFYDIPKKDIIKEEIIRQYEELLLEYENELKEYGVEITEDFWKKGID